MSGPPDILLFFGRFHPLLVHLPIGLIFLLASVELAGLWPRFARVRDSAGFILALAVPLSLGTALCGWLLSLAGGYESSLLWWHQWTGIATAAACALTGLLYWLNARRGYRGCLFVTMAALVAAGHFGGSLTHGRDYLVRYAPGPLRSLVSGPAKALPPAPAAKSVDIASLPAFGGVIKPLLEKDCVECHGPEKSKGGLRVDSLPALLKGGKSGLALAPGKADESEMLRRLRLPPSDEDHMPPEGKPQLTAQDIAVLAWWIGAGAPSETRLGDLKPPGRIMQALAQRFGAPAAPAKSVAPKALEGLMSSLDHLAEQLHVVLSPVSQGDPWIQCNASVAGTNFGDAELARLAPLAANLRWLDLAGTRVSDAGLAQVGGFANLARLHLERTGITDAGLPHLAGLANLEFLDLYATAVSDAGLESLRSLPKLKRLYLWQTKVTAGAAHALAEAHADRDQIQRWQKEIEELKAKIGDQQLSVDLGTVAVAPPATNRIPVNTQCPVSGKPIDASKTTIHDGNLIAFCCDDCKAKFLQDPKPFLAKLVLRATPPPAETKP